MIIEGTQWRAAALHALGASIVRDMRDGNGELTGYEVEPDIDLAGYAAAEADIAKAELAAYAADKRWRVETGGITVSGATIDTSRESQAMITGAYAYSQANPTQTISYKAASGWATIDAATMAAIATAVGAHVQSCFAAEEAVAAEIEAGTITTIEQIEAADWPQS